MADTHGTPTKTGPAMGCDIPNSGAGDELSFDANNVAVTIGRWRAELDQHRRGATDNADTIELDRLLSGFSRVLRGDADLTFGAELAAYADASKSAVTAAAEKLGEFETWRVPRTVTSIFDDAVLNLDESCKQLYQLAAQFDAIAAARAGASPLDTVRALANLGSYTANDWANAADCAREDLLSALQQVVK